MPEVQIAVGKNLVLSVCLVPPSLYGSMFVHTIIYTGCEEITIVAKLEPYCNGLSARTRKAVLVGLSTEWFMTKILSVRKATGNHLINNHLPRKMIGALPLIIAMLEIEIAMQMALRAKLPKLKN